MVNLVDIWTACATWDGWVGRIVIGKFLKTKQISEIIWFKKNTSNLFADC